MNIRALGVIFVVVLLALPACSASGLNVSPAATPTLLPQEQGPPPTQNLSSPLTVVAADSLAAPFTELGQVFEATHPGIKVLFNFASSTQLVLQLSQNATADVFASDLSTDMDSAVQAGRVAKDMPKIFAENKLVVIFPASNPGGILKLQDLAKPGLKLALADATTPLGAYTTTFLSLAAIDPDFSPSFQADVEKNVVAYEDSSKAVATRVAASQADAGICYWTEIAGDRAASLGKLGILDALNLAVQYPIAATTNSSVLAQAFVDLVLSSQGQQVMLKYGFIPTNP
jgi:molybdate transport system substrate-binding protein